MTLTRRLTLFFLVALAGVLAAFSAALYLLAHEHLRQVLDDKLAATLNVLVAAAEVNPEGVEWEPDQRLLQIPHDPAAPVRWLVRGDRPFGRDRSADPNEEPLPEFPRDENRPFHHRDAAGRRWLIRQVTIQYDGPARTPTEPRHHTKLTFTAAVGVGPTERLLARLAFTLAAVSLAVLLLAVLGSRWLVQRALRPVRDMADATALLKATDLAERLPVPIPPDELRQLATAFNDLLARVQLAFERQASFTGEASHQLRTPLTALLGQLDVALRRDRNPDDYRRALTAAHSEAQRLHRLVESLLFLARADGDATMPDTQPVDLTTWLPKHFAEKWHDHPRELSIRVVAPDHPTVVAVHPPLFAQAVDNVVDNSFKHGMNFTLVTVTVARRGESVVITVDDMGPGIPEADRGRVFEPFYRSPDARRGGIEGTGLGLSVTARIVRAFGGKVSALPHQGGARIAIVLPAAGG